MTDQSPATRTVCVQPNVHFDSASERVIDHFNMTSSIICCNLLSPYSSINSDQDSYAIKQCTQMCHQIEELQHKMNANQFINSDPGAD